MAHLRKVSLALDPGLVDDLDYSAGRLGISRSALVNSLLLNGVGPMRKLLEQVPLSPTPADLVRFRGDSVKVIEERLSALEGASDDLFSRI